jgi:hypothetical protein
MAYNGADVTIVRSDTTAGSAVIHLVDLHILGYPPQRVFWAQQAKNVGCGEGRCGGGGPAVNAGMIAGETNAWPPNWCLINHCLISLSICWVVFLVTCFY